MAVTYSVLLGNRFAWYHGVYFVASFTPGGLARVVIEINSNGIHISIVCPCNNFEVSTQVLMSIMNLRGSVRGKRTIPKG